MMLNSFLSLFAFILLSTITICAKDAQLQDLLPTKIIPDIIHIINTNYSPNDQLLLQTLQGQLAYQAVEKSNSNSTIEYIYRSNVDDKSAMALYLNVLQSHYPRVKYSMNLYNASLHDIIQYFRQQFTGYLLVNSSSESVNVGVSLLSAYNTWSSSAHQKTALLVADSSHLSLFESLIPPLPLLLDVIKYTEGDLLAYLAKYSIIHGVSSWPFSRHFIAVQTASAALTALSDFTILLNSIQITHAKTYTYVLENELDSTQFNIIFGWPASSVKLSQHFRLANRFEISWQLLLTWRRISYLP
jgi:hypothetical protein